MMYSENALHCQYSERWILLQGKKNFESWGYYGERIIGKDGYGLSTNFKISFLKSRREFAVSSGKGKYVIVVIWSKTVL